MNATDYLFVSSGALKSDREQGVLGVYTTSIAPKAWGAEHWYNTPSRAGGVRIASVSWPYMTLIGGNLYDDSVPVVTFRFNLQTRTWEQPAPCQLFPLALNADLVQGLQNQLGIYDTTYGISTHNFGWLSWNGSMITDTLATSLTPPGDSSTYTNPDNPADHTVSIGDWVLGRPELDTSSPPIERALSSFTIGGTPYNIPSGYAEVTVPIWDQAVRQGSTIRYHVSGFIWMSVDHYSFAQPNQVSFYYGGHPTCPDTP